MIFSTPILSQEEEDVLGQIRGLWSRLKFALAQQPYRWSGFLRRSSFARAIRGSNSIEGYTVTPDDAFAAAGSEEPYEASDEAWAAVTGYRDAMTYVIQMAEDPYFECDESVLRSLHFMMLKYDLTKHPGSWRPGVIFVRDDEHGGRKVYEGPPAEDVPGLVKELVLTIRSGSSDVSPMITAAMAHLNLVMIHPFSDGNGRMARCLQTLVLARAGVLDPTFCSVEEYLGRNTASYYEMLALVGGGSWQPERDALPWVRFCLTAHYRQAATLVRRQIEIAAIWADVEALAAEKGIPERAVPSLVESALHFRVRNSTYRRHADVSQVVASRDLKAAVEAGFLIAKGERRGRYYMPGDPLSAIREAHRHPKPVEDPFESAAA